MPVSLSNATPVNKFNIQQRKAIDSVIGAYVVDAGAGSGKTATITERTRCLLVSGVSPHRILLLTFTVKAAGEMNSRVESATGQRLVWAMNFHRLCMKLLRMFPEFGIPNPDVVTADDQRSMLRRLAREGGVEGIDASYLKKVLKQVQTQRLFRLGYSRFEVTMEAQRNRNLKEIADAYEKALETSGKVDFDRMIFHVVLTLRKNKGLALVIQGLWDYAIIDEAQDTSAAQFELLTLLVPPIGGRHKNIMLVGDMDQCIFSFAGAEVGNMNAFIQTYEAEVLPLELNYRSRAEILETANTVINDNKERLQKTLRPTLGTGGIVDIVEARDTGLEARWVAGQIRDAIRGGTSPKDIAVLFRTSALSREIEGSLTPWSINYRVVGGLKFWERREVQDTVALAKLLVGRKDNVAWERITGAIPMGVGEKRWIEIRSVEGIENGIRQLGSSKAKFFLERLEGARSLMASAGPHAALTHLVEVSGLQQVVLSAAKSPEEGRDRIGNIVETLNSLAQSLGHGTDLNGWLDEIGVGGGHDEKENDRPKVTLSTIHAAKGLEWRRVYLVGVTDDILPITYAATEREIEEERRLLYVAITRAKDQLTMSYPKLRMDQGTRKPAIRSRFLAKFNAKRKLA